MSREGRPLKTEAFCWRKQSFSEVHQSAVPHVAAADFRGRLTPVLGDKNCGTDYPAPQASKYPPRTPRVILRFRRFSRADRRFGFDRKGSQRDELASADPVHLECTPRTCSSGPPLRT